ncbi:Hypothetical protein P9303_27591 [Prochlorococcus marinus str. MIT 9303]|uniref:Uncharacterized protein n=1 Tax=Prochlorococcus marinus (strain MIT 9303) TaxID=59922 RepID=A2CDC9_PROM3|nr:Hypothetical protein P9303_27591 [Prochlorococcus marinus str. MIT 9303]
MKCVQVLGQEQYWLAIEAPMTKISQTISVEEGYRYPNQKIWQAYHTLGSIIQNF